MDLRKAAVALAVVIVLLGGGAAVWMWKAGERIHSSPSAVRSDTAYALAHAPKTNIVVPRFYAPSSIERTQQNITVSIVDTPTPDDRLFMASGEIQRADGAQVVKIGEGSVRLDSITMGYAVPRTNFDYGITFEGRVFGPDLKELSPEKWRELPRHQREVTFEGEFPEWNFHFVSSNLPTCLALRFEAFDARTHYSISTGTRSWSQEKEFHYASALRVWHQTPVKIMTTVAVGPEETYTMPAREGADLTFPGGSMRMLLVTEEEIFSWGSNSRDGTNTLRFQSKPRDEQAQVRSTVVFYCWPSGIHAPVQIEFLGKEGEVLKTHGGGASSGMRMVQVEAEPSELGSVKVKYFPNVHRLIFTLPELPGLPEENRNVTDLFDVRIPYMRFEYEHEYQNTVMDLVQLKADHFALTFPTGYFPLVRTNTTPRELFAQMDLLRSDRTRDLYVNAEKHAVEVRMDPVRALFIKLREKLAK